MLHIGLTIAATYWIRLRAPDSAPYNPAVADLFQQLAAKSSTYSAKDIEVLEGLEPVRRRPGMYIGGTDERAMHHLVAEALDNAMDEAVAGHATWIEVQLDADGTAHVRDNGRIGDQLRLAEDERFGSYFRLVESTAFKFRENYRTVRASS